MEVVILVVVYRVRLSYGCNSYSVFFCFADLHLSTILVINQYNAKILFYNKFIIRLYVFRALCAHHQEVKIVLCSIWYHQT